MLDWNKNVSESYKDDHLKDVKFHVENHDCEEIASASYQEFHAHSYILASASPVFQAMLYGPLSSTFQPLVPIVIQDTTPHAFSALLLHIYHNHQPQGSPSELLEVCNLAHRYQLQTLQSIAEEKLRTCEVLSAGLLSTCRALERHQHLDRAARIMRTVCRRMLVRKLTFMGVGVVKELINNIKNEEDLLCVMHLFNLM